MLNLGKLNKQMHKLHKSGMKKIFSNFTSFYLFIYLQDVQNNICSQSNYIFAINIERAHFDLLTIQTLTPW